MRPALPGSSISLVAAQQKRSYACCEEEPTMSAVWNTKWGARRVRHDPPTLVEALAAAQGLTDNRDAQVAIAADLMGVPLDDAKAEMRRLAPDRRAAVTVVTPARDKGGVRTVLIERKVSRRLQRDVAGRRDGALTR